MLLVLVPRAENAGWAPTRTSGPLCTVLPCWPGAVRQITCWLPAAAVAPCSPGPPSPGYLLDRRRASLRGAGLTGGGRCSGLGGSGLPSRTLCLTRWKGTGAVGLRGTQSWVWGVQAPSPSQRHLLGWAQRSLP